MAAWERINGEKKNCSDGKHHVAVYFPYLQPISI